MFHRRLLLLGVCIFAAIGVLGAQAARLTTGEEHLRRKAQAEAALRVQELIPTVRGRILDRHDRVLAMDEAGWEVAVTFPVISGDWVYDQAVAAAQRANWRMWSEFSSDERAALIDQAKVRFEEQVEMLWRTLADLAHVERAEVERRKDTIRRNVQNLTSYVQTRRWQQRREQLRHDVSFMDAVVQEPLREELAPHAVLTQLDDAARVQIQGFIAEANRNRATTVASENPMLVWTQVELRRPKRRIYPLESMTLEIDRSTLPGPLQSDEPVEMAVDGVATLILGTMRDVWQEDISGASGRPLRRPGERAIHDLGGYLAGDRVGSTGIERTFEGAPDQHGLRGLRGVAIRHRDTQREERVEPVPGRDIHLTLDIQLQARIQAIMTPDLGLMKTQPWHANHEDLERFLGRSLNGSAVVLDIASNEVLAAVSMPAVSRQQLEEDSANVYRDFTNLPFINRPVGMPYEPGSTVKPLIAAAAMTDGKLGLDELVYCEGYLWPSSPNVYRDWLFKSHGIPFGEIDVTTAIARSSNVFFGRMAQRMGIQRTVWWFHQFGAGHPLGVSLAEEVGGDLPDWQKPLLGRSARADAERDAAFMAIGQGPLRWTPVQTAAAYRALITNDLRPPRFVIDEPDRGGQPLNLSRAAVDRVLEGMRQSANWRQGTTYALNLLEGRPRIFDVPGVTVRAKSGTAQAAPRREPIDDDGDGLPDRWGKILLGSTQGEFWGDHSWTVAYVQPDGAPRPTHVVVVVVEYAGSGGQIAGPIVNQIIHSLRQEGYL